jgi:UDP-N-acetylglucosamine acyltransferase
MVQGLTAVSQDMPPFCTAYGINQLAGLNTIGLRRAGFNADERAAVKRAYKLMFQSDLTREAALAEAATLEWPEPAARFLAAIANPSKKGVMSP